MAANRQISSRLFVIFLFVQIFYTANSQSFLGVNFGQNGDNLPSLEETVNLLKSSGFKNVRLFVADPAVIKALANTNIGIVIGVGNGDIPALATSPNSATQWLQNNLLPFYPASNIIMITVGNEILTSGNQNLISMLVPAMQNLQNALNAASLGRRVKVSTVHAMSVLGKSYPPSAGAFDQRQAETMKAVVQFLSSANSPFMVNPYPFFAYRDNPTEDTLAYCLFRGNRPDPGNGLKYTNMFDAQVDAVRSALNAMGSKDVEIVVAETGWPHGGDSNEPGATLDNAKAYVGNLIKHLSSKAGTPLMPGKTIDTYIFSLYDENKKSGPASERSFGIFKPDGSMNYDVGLNKKNGEATPSNPSTASNPSTPKAVDGTWCVPKPEIPDAKLKGNIDYVCSQGIDCSPIKSGGACFQPDNIRSHAAYLMNLYYQKNGRNRWNCDFSNTAMLISIDPSYDGCKYLSN